MNSKVTCVPSLEDKIYKEECVLCFKTSETKIWCCVVCFEGFCEEHHNLHIKKYSTHSNFLIVHKKRKQILELDEEMKQAKQMKLEIPADKERNAEFEYFYEAEGNEFVLSDLTALIDSNSCSSLNSTSVNSESWSEPSAQACEHVLMLSVQNEEIPDSYAETCSKCDLKNNLWKCLTCGALSCGRRQFDGSGGNGHALDHFQSTGHELALKLGTIAVKSDGLEADVYCYKCDEMVLDPELNLHLSLLGIDPTASRKTEKSTAELNLEINLTHSYAMVDASGIDLKELKGPWHRGFTNLGNSCYLASVLQSLRNLNRKDFLAYEHDYVTCTISRATDCLLCQLHKLFLGLGSESTDDTTPLLRPWMFKRLAAGSNVEFNSGRQQDASEFLSHLLQNCFKRIPTLASLVKKFEFKIEEVLTCGGCGNFRSKINTETSLILTTPEDQITCDFDELLRGRFAPEIIEWCCDVCKGSQAGTYKQTRLIALPDFLVIVANRLKLKNWVPEKAECHIEGMDQVLSLEQFCAESSNTESGSNDNDNEKNKSNKISADPVLLGELLLMGIEEEAAKSALIACNNSSVDAAMSIIFEGNDSTNSSSIDYSIETLMAAGFSKDEAVRALEETNGDLERAFDWIFSHLEDESPKLTSSTINNLNFNNTKYQLNSFITHKGNSMFCGHYVVHLRDEEMEMEGGKENPWVLYNDDKVAKAELDESFPIEDAYIYIYKKI